MRLIRQSDHVIPCDIELRFDIVATRLSLWVALQIEVDVAWYRMIALRINLMNISAVTIFLARVVHTPQIITLRPRSLFIIAETCTTVCCLRKALDWTDFFLAGFFTLPYHTPRKWVRPPKISTCKVADPEIKHVLINGILRCWKITNFRPVPILVLFTRNWFVRTNFRSFEGLKTKWHRNLRASKPKEIFI